VVKCQKCDSHAYHSHEATIHHWVQSSHTPRIFRTRPTCFHPVSTNRGSPGSFHQHLLARRVKQLNSYAIDRDLNYCLNIPASTQTHLEPPAQSTITCQLDESDCWTIGSSISTWTLSRRTILDAGPREHCQSPLAEQVSPSSYPLSNALSLN